MSAVAAGIIAGGAVIGSVIQSNAAQNAAQQQANAAQNAQNLQLSMFNTTLGNEQPFINAGQGATSQLQYLLGTGNQGGSSPLGGFGSLNAPFTMDTFKKYSPAYQFQLQQGQQGTLNQDASGQGALSGAALKDLTSFNQGFANSAFNNAFNQYQTQQSNVFNRLNDMAGMGQAAASNQASGASSFGASAGQSAQNVGTALAGGTVGSANAIAGGIGNLSSIPWLMQGQTGAQNSANAGYGAFVGANAGDPMYQTPSFNPSYTGP